MLRILVVGLVLLVAAVILVPRRAVPPPAQATELPEPLALPAIEFVDQTGEPFRTSDLGGQFSLIFFGFTHCPDVCPLSLQVLAEARAQMRERNARVLPQVVLVSVDPARDTPERLRRYLANFDPDFIGLTAPEEALAPLLQTLGVTVMKQDLPGGSYNMTHNPQVFMTSPAGEIIAVLSRAGQAEVVVTDFTRIRQRFLNGSIGTPAGR